MLWFDASLLLYLTVFEIIILLVKVFFGESQAECKLCLSVSRYSGFLVQASVIVLYLHVVMLLFV